MLPRITDVMGEQKSVSKLTLWLITLISSIKAYGSHADYTKGVKSNYIIP